MMEGWIGEGDKEEGWREEGGKLRVIIANM